MYIFTEKRKHQMTGKTAMKTIINQSACFEPNVGQTDDAVKFIARCKNSSVFIVEGGLVLAMAHGSDHKSGDMTDTVKIEFTGANQSASYEGEHPLPGVINYLIGNDSSKWISEIRSYESVRCINAYQNTDIVFYFERTGLEFDFVLKPGANPNEIGISFGGSEHVSADFDGNLIISAGQNSISLLKPKVIQVSEESQEEISSAYQLGDDGVVRLKLGAYNPAIDLVIDPAIVYSTFLGGTEQSLGEGAYGVTVDGEGNAYVIGYTSAPDFPTQDALQTSLYGTADVFVSKISRDGQELEYSTYLGGNAVDFGTGIALDQYGNVYLTGYTNSTDFPVKNAFQSSLNGLQDAFVTKLSPNGNNIVYSTYLGGSLTDMAKGIAVDASGSAYVTGSTSSDDFPVENAVLPTLQGPINAFITKLSPAGNRLMYSTYLGGSAEDVANAIAIGTDGSAYITGSTSSPDLPVKNAFQPQLNNQQGLRDVFVTKLNLAGNDIAYCTYLGGGQDDFGDGITVDRQGNAFVVGTTFSTNFPVNNALQPDLTSTANCFISKFAPDGKTLAFSTYLGGTGYDYGSTIALDAQNDVHVTGSTTSADFPLKDAVQSLYGGNTDAFLSILKGDGSALQFSTYLGGNNTEIGNSIAVGKYGDVMAGVTMSGDFPTFDPIQSSLIGVSDAFITSISSAKPSLSLSMNVSKKCAYWSQTLDYFLRLSNTGFGVAKNILIKDTLPCNVRLLQVIPDLGNYSNNCGILTWKIDQLNAGQTAECKITVQITRLGDAVNVAEIKFGQEDAIAGEKCVAAVTGTFAKLTTGAIKKEQGFPHSMVVTIKNTREFAQMIEIRVVNLEKCMNDRCIQKIVSQNSTISIELSDLPDKCEVIFNALQEGVCICAFITAENGCSPGYKNDVALRFLS